MLANVPGSSFNDKVVTLYEQAEQFQNKAPAKATAKATTKEEGVVFISSSGSMYTAPEIDADKIKEFLGNPYLKSALNSYMTLIFPAPVEVEVLNDKDEVDEEQTKQFRKMCDKPTVRVNELMKKAYWNRYIFGAGVLNPAWTRDGNEILPGNFRVLPSGSFDQLPEGYEEMYSSIMPGIVQNERKQAEAWQMQSIDDSTPTQIKNFFLIRDPMDDGLAGESKIVPLISILDMLKYCWNTEMQACNRAGSPIMFIKVTTPQKANNNNGGVSDVDYANTVLKNWSKNKQYQPRENMELITIDAKNSKDILGTISVLEQVINDYFSPTKLISKDGSHPLGSSGPELQLLNQAIQSEHRWLEDQFEQLFNRYFEYNGFPEGYRVKFTLPVIEPDQSELNIKQTETAIKAKAVDMDDIRAKLGFDAADDEKKAAIEAFWQSQASMQPVAFQNKQTGTTEHPEQFSTHPYVAAIEEGEEAVDKELHASIDKAGDAIMEALKEAEQ